MRCSDNGSDKTARLKIGNGIAIHQCVADYLCISLFRQYFSEKNSISFDIHTWFQNSAYADESIILLNATLGEFLIICRYSKNVIVN